MMRTPRRQIQSQRQAPAEPQRGAQVVIDWDGLDALFAALRDAGFLIIGPSVHDAAIVLDQLSSAADLPVGVGDLQDGGTYRLRQRGDRAAFGYAVGPQSWRRFLSPPRELLWRATKSSQGFSITSEAGATSTDSRRYAFVGVRACDLRAMEIQDLVFKNDAFADPRYASRRADALIIAVNCTEPAGTCFCVSMGTGPRANAGYDLALTEVTEGAHHFIVDIGSDAGAEVLAPVPHRLAGANEVAEATALVDDAATRMGRTMDSRGLQELLAATLEHPRWDDGRGALPFLRQLHPGVPDLFLLDCGGHHRPDR